MEQALDDFTARQDPFSSGIIERLNIYLSEDEMEDDWVLRELATHIMHCSPLSVSSAQHSVFYSLVRGFAVNFVAPNPTEFMFIVDGGAKVIEVSYLAGLIVVLRTLIDPRIHTRLQSVNDLPRNIMLLFLKRNGMREYLMKNIFASVEDQLDVMQLYKEAVIGAATMESLAAMHQAAVSMGNCETPINEPQYYRGHNGRSIAFSGDRDDDNEDSLPDEDALNERPLVLPLRRPINTYRVGIGSKTQLQLLCTIYTYLRPELANVMHELAQSSNTRALALCNLEFLFGALYTSITETLDNQSSGSRALRELYGDEGLRPLMNRIDEIGAEIVRLMRGESQSLVLRLKHENHTEFVNHFYAEMENTFPEFVLGQRTPSASPTANPDQGLLSRPRRWIPVSCCSMPISLLIAKLTADGSLFTPMLRLKSFFNGRHRSDFLAYELPAGTTRVSLELSLMCIKKRYMSAFPQLFTHAHYIVVSRHVVYLIAEPETIECMKLLMLLEALPDRPAIHTFNFYTNVFVKALAVARPDTLLKDLSMFCIVHAMTVMLGGRRALGLLAVPGEPAYALYQLLPRLMKSFPNMEDPAQRKAVLGFLCIKRRIQKLNATVLEMLVERETDPFPTDSDLQREIHRLGIKNQTLQDGIVPDTTATGRRYKDCVLTGRCKVPLWFSIYECILSDRHTLQDEECYVLLCALGCEKIPKTFRRPDRSGIDPDEPISLPLQLHSAKTLRKENTARRYNILQASPLFREAEDLIGDVQLNRDSDRQFSRTEHAFPRTFREIADGYQELAAGLLKLEQLAFCYPERRREIANLPVLSHHHLVRHEFDFQLSLDDQLSITFEECLFLCDNPSKWVQSALPDSDLLFASPMETVVDCAQLLEFALLYNEDWVPGRLSENTRFANGHYSELVRLVQKRTAMATTTTTVAAGEQ